MYREPLYFTPSSRKLLIMSICTVGIYNVYWFYRNFVNIKRYNKDDTIPIIRTIFSTLFCFIIFKHLVQAANKFNVNNSMNEWLLTFAFVLFSIAGSSIEPILVFSHLTIIPLLMANNLGIKINQSMISNYQPDNIFSKPNIVGIIAGIILNILAFSEYLSVNNDNLLLNNAPTTQQELHQPQFEDDDFDDYM